MDEFDIFTPELDSVESSAMVLRARECFSSSIDFMEIMDLPMPEITEADKREALQIFHEAPLAPSKPTTLGAARMLNNLLAKYDYQILDPTTKMRNYVMYKFFELAENEDVKTSMRALENLAKTSEIGLFSEKVEVNINQKSTSDLEKDLATLVAGILGKSKSKVVDAEFREI